MQLTRKEVEGSIIGGTNETVFDALRVLALIDERDDSRAQVAALREALETWAWAHHDPRWSEDDARRAKALGLTLPALASTVTVAAEHDARVRQEALEEAVRSIGAGCSCHSHGCSHDDTVDHIRMELRALAAKGAK